MEIYKSHRPRKLEDVIGQPEAVQTLQGYLREGNLPHALLFTGASGVGKTTLARILKRELKCGKSDFHEINCALAEAMDTVREISLRVHQAAFGPCRIWLLDEVQSLSRAGFAQQALLKTLEDTPSHVYFILASSDPSKIIKAIRTRCTEIPLRLLSEGELISLIQSVAGKEGKEISRDVVVKIADVVEGSARKALVLLEQVIDLENEKDQLEIIQKADSKRQAIEIARGLINGSKWSDIAAVLKSVEDEPETIRHLVLSYCRTILLGGGKMAPRAFMVLTCFEGSFFESKAPGLARACWEATQSRG